MAYCSGANACLINAAIESIPLIVVWIGAVIHPKTRKATLKITSIFLIFIILLPALLLSLLGVLLVLARYSILLAIAGGVILAYGVFTLTHKMWGRDGMVWKVDSVGEIKKACTINSTIKIDKKRLLQASIPLLLVIILAILVLFFHKS